MISSVFNDLKNDFGQSITPDQKVASIKKQNIAREYLGQRMRLLSGSKSFYLKKYPNHVVFFNANVYDSNGQKLWYGDIDLNKERENLNSLANKLNECIYVTTESFRFVSVNTDYLEDRIKEKDLRVVKICPA